MKITDTQADLMRDSNMENHVAPGFLEICVDSIASASAAIEGGADRLEVCNALQLGGLTPSSGLVRAVVTMAKPAGVSVRALVRPRAGNFIYNVHERAQARIESETLLRDGVDGLVFGALNENAICKETLIAWRDAVRQMPYGDTAGLTLHRAIDLTANPIAQVAVAIEIGFDQILTSGGARAALDGMICLSAMVKHAGSKCRIVAASGIKPKDVATLVATTANRAIHASARMESDEDTLAIDPFGFGTACPPTSQSVVRALRTAIDQQAC